MKRPLCLLLLCITLTAHAQLNIVPQPVKTVRNTGAFQLSAQTVLVLMDEGERQSADFLNDYLERYYKFRLRTVKEASANYLRLATRRFIRPGTEGKYNLQVTPAGISIEGDTYSGTFYGVQTLIQMLPVAPAASMTISAVAIEDQPRFSYRGLHLDVSRHFAPVSFIKRYIDFLALHKLNYFHWHLTDDQGWRIEIKKYPQLINVGAFRNGTIIGRYPGKGNDNIPYGGYYTQEEVKEVVDYAAKRFITVVPEIEMPGHASAAIAAYPWLSCFPDQKTHIPDNMISDASKAATGKLVQETWGVFDDVFCAGKDSTFGFLQDIMDEVIPLFPGQYVHIGGDECPKTHWKKCPRCQQRMKELGLKDEHELQSYFIQRMEKYINAKGKTIIGWDEILEGGLAPNAIVMSWRGEQGGIEAARQNHKVIMTPGNYVYLDHTQTKNEDSVTIGGYTPLEEVYNYDPVPKELAADKHRFIMGAQGNVWTEYMNNTRKVEYMVFPRLAALSEVLWTPKEKKHYKAFERRVHAIMARYNMWFINYSKAFYDLRASITPAPGNNGLLWTLGSNFLTLSPQGSQGSIYVSYPNAGNKKVKVTLPGRDKDPDGSKGFMKESYMIPSTLDMKYTTPFRITGSGSYSAGLKVTGGGSGAHLLSSIRQNFSFNKATGKKVTLKAAPSPSYPGNGGAFGLINGVASENGLSSPEWLGWNNGDMQAVIDLVQPVTLSSVSIHTLEQNASWIYAPAAVEVYLSKDGTNYAKAGTSRQFDKDGSGFSTGYMTVTFNPSTARFIRVIAKNYGKIPDDKPGAGNTAWLFVDEIKAN